MSNILCIYYYTKGRQQVGILVLCVYYSLYIVINAAFGFYNSILRTVPGRGIIIVLIVERAREINNSPVT